MAVAPKGGLDIIMAEPLAHQEDGRPQSDEQGGVGVAQIVESDLLQSAGIAPIPHLMMEVVLCEGEKPVIRVRIIDGIQVSAPVIKCKKLYQ